MKAYWRRLCHLDTLAVRLTLFLAIGGTFAAISALYLAEHYRLGQMREFRAEMILHSAQDIESLVGANDPSDIAMLRANKIRGAHLLHSQNFPVREVDRLITRRLVQGLPQVRHLVAFRTDIAVCTGRPDAGYVRAVAGLLVTTPECWIVAVDVRGREGRFQRLIIALDTAPLPRPPALGLSPGFALLVSAAALVLSWLVARVTLGFMRRLTIASQRFAGDIDAEPVAEVGPRDVRETFAAFNQMQHRVRDALRDRTQILAAISHDLQTPLTRMRLRLDLLPDDTLRSRLITDVLAMHRLVTEGLTLARSSEASDDWVMFDIESLLVSLVEDMHDAGAGPVTLGTVEQLEVLVKPDALHRCLQNLVDNAIRYGGSATLDCSLVNERVEIRVTDSGPGIPVAKLDEMFKPFVRGEGSRSRRTGGTGIGLTIARAQAATFGAEIRLANLPEGGLTATISIPATSERS